MTRSCRNIPCSLPLPSRRSLLGGLASASLLPGLSAMSLSSSSLAAEADPAKPAVMTGAAYLQSVGFAPLAGKRVGLITNQTGRVGEHHLADLIAKAEGVRLTAI